MSNLLNYGAKKADIVFELYANEYEMGSGVMQISSTLPLTPNHVHCTPR